ncbi:MAG: proprotein convertase P-domain-containing protein [Saprospiraceae bacterium]|nr:proprotein convertase P-domain-containing protein [Saprospiraceae bacterium]
MLHLLRCSGLALSLVLGLTAHLSAQNPSLWQELPESQISAPAHARLIIPQRYDTWRLQLAQLKTLLQTAPRELEVVKGETGIWLELPMADGELRWFEVWESPIMAPELAAEYPNIRTYAGRDADRRGITVRFDVTPAGFHAMFLLPGESSTFIDPYARGNTSDYVCYSKKDFVKQVGAFSCQVGGEEHQVYGTPVSDRSAPDCANLRVYQLALACTGEYANFHGSFGADKAPALAAMVTSMNRVNGVYIRDAGVRMDIIANNSNLIFTDGTTDPYTNDDGSTMLGQNQTTCDGIIGSANYDIGHVFSTGGGGVAYLGCVCNGAIKAGGVTGGSSPVGDPFDIDYVAHEMGHQFGANHTQFNNCNRNNATAMEPGSASTIMGYAGICDPNVQSNSDDFFHAISLQEMAAFVVGSGNTCATPQASGNIVPVAAAVVDRTVPYSTPFILTGSATDANPGTVLTYCWEQMNGYSVSQPMPPQSTNTSGPMFRSYDPETSGSRYFPKFEDAVSGFDDPWEELPSVGRTMNFRMTVRDNHPISGCTTEKNLVITTSGSIGPFAVTEPNGGESYAVGSTQTVTWNVAGSNNAPVSCATVNILLSTDGGLNFSTLVANTPNDGSQTVTYNVAATSTARILIQAVGHIFYDVSNADFFIGVSNNCNQDYLSIDVPKTIPNLGSAVSTLNMGVSGLITDVDVINLSGNHTRVGQLIVKLKSPSGTERILFSQICGNNDNFNLNFDDEAATPYASIPCPPTTGGNYKPNQTLSAFDGEDLFGTWTLTVSDVANPTSGTLLSWGLSFCTALALPVELTRFDAILQKNTVRLDWTVATEQNNRGFQVERSVDNALDFQPLGWVEGRGTATTPHTYAFTDTDIRPGALYYYRLRQEDFSGEAVYSDIRAVATTGAGGPLGIWPNPARESLRLLLPDAAFEGETLPELQVLNSLGVVVQRQALSAPGEALPVQALPPGVYTLHVTAGQRTWNGVLVKE